MTLVTIFQMRNPELNTLKHKGRKLELFVKNVTTQPTFGKKIRLLFNVKNVDIEQLFVAEQL